MAGLCTWCGTDQETGAEGFCSEACRSDFQTACQLWGEGAEAVPIWQLRISLARHAPRDPATAR